jgi:hypothetical protein
MRVEGDPLMQGVCSCLDCQWRTGSVISVNAGYPADRVVLKGEVREFRRSSDNGNEVVFRFCPACGTTLSWDLATPGVVVIAVGCLTDRDFPTPNIAVYGHRRPDWVCLADTIPEHFG